MNITLGDLFHGHESVLIQCFRGFNRGQNAKRVAELHIAPIIGDLEKNAGQQMLPEYIAYAIQYAILQRCKPQTSSTN